MIPPKTNLETKSSFLSNLVPRIEKHLEKYSRFYTVNFVLATIVAVSAASWTIGNIAGKQIAMTEANHNKTEIETLKDDVKLLKGRTNQDLELIEILYLMSFDNITEAHSKIDELIESSNENRIKYLAMEFKERLIFRTSSGLEKYSELEKVGNEMKSIDPKPFNSYHWLGMASLGLYVNTGNVQSLELAKSYFRKSINIFPAQTKDRINLCEVLIADGLRHSQTNKKMASEMYKEALLVIADFRLEKEKKAIHPSEFESLLIDYLESILRTLTQDDNNSIVDNTLETLRKFDRKKAGSYNIEEIKTLIDNDSLMNPITKSNVLNLISIMDSLSTKK